MKSVFDKIAMKKLEEMYPEKVKRFDELYDKEKQGAISEEEKRELDRLDSFLLREFERIKMHYRLNWPFMSQEQRKKLLNEIETG